MLVSLFYLSCGGSKAQFFVFSENQRVYHDRNVIRNVFPKWDLDISLMSPQADYWYNTCATCSDYDYHMTILSVNREDSISVWNLESRGWSPLKTPHVTDRIVTDSIVITFLPANKIIVIHVDSDRFEESPKYYIPGLHYRFDNFSIPKKPTACVYSLKQL